MRSANVSNHENLVALHLNFVNVFLVAQRQKAACGTWALLEHVSPDFYFNPYHYRNTHRRCIFNFNFMIIDEKAKFSVNLNIPPQSHPVTFFPASTLHIAHY